MTGNLITYLSTPSDFLKDSRVKLLLSLGTTLFAGLFLWFFGPFGLAIYHADVKAELIFFYCVFGYAIFVLHLYLLQKLVIRKYTIGATILWLIWICLVIGLSNFLIFEIIVGKGEFLWRGLHIMEFQTLLIGALPISFTVMFYNSYLLKKRIRLINQINSDISKFRNQETFQNGLLTLSSSNMKEFLTVDPGSLLYLASADNYVEVCRLENGEIKRSLLRNTLSEAGKELVKQFESARRCHNSFIVNLNRIKSIEGNEAGYRIILDGTDSVIPISRKYKKDIFGYLKR